MHTVTSRDGTKIAYDRVGEGTRLILIDGAMCKRSDNAKPELVKQLSAEFKVISYDRRGRGDSGDTQPYAVEREVEDIEALIEAEGGEAYLYGHSSGAALGLEAAIRLPSVKKLAMYEAPYNDDPEAKRRWHAYIEELTKLLTENRRGDAIALFMRLVGTPDEAIAGMRHAPFWAGLEELAPTLAYDHTALLGQEAVVPVDKAKQVTIPAIALSGSKSFPFMRETAETLAQSMPRGKFVSVEGQDHNVMPDALVPVLIENLK